MSFRTQIVVSTTALTALGMLLVTLGLQLVVHRIVEGNLDRVLEDRAESVIATVEAGSSRAALVVPPGVLDPGVVVFDDRGRHLAGSPAPRVAQEVRQLSRTDRRTILDVGEDQRLLAEPFTTKEGARGVVVVSEPLTPYEQTELYVALASIVVGLLVVGAVGAIARWVTARTLAPVAQMAERATDWSEHDLSHRFELGPPVNELSALGATLDGLLERVAMTIRAEQRLTAELAHELRTPLAAIQGTADLALLRGGLGKEARTDVEQIAASSRVMAETITTLLDLARDPYIGSQDSTSRLGAVVDGVSRLVPRGLVLADETEAARGVRLAAPTDLAVRALAPLVENAVRHASSRVTLSALVSASSVDLRVGDDGPGIDESVRARLFSPGAAGPQGGTGLGLGIARRVARTVGGDVLVEEGTGDGAAFLLRLPRV
jgi:signal transduction histidine kinase